MNTLEKRIRETYPDVKLECLKCTDDSIRIICHLSKELQIVYRKGWYPALIYDQKYHTHKDDETALWNFVSQYIEAYK